MADPAAVGIHGLLFVLKPSTSAGAGAARVQVDTTALDAVFGGDASARATLVELPACALTTPNVKGCLKQTRIPAHLDAAHHRLTATVTLPGAATLAGAAPAGVGAAHATNAAYSTAAPALGSSGAMVLAADTTSAGGAGTFAATSLAPSANWEAGGSNGGFAYSYPITTPPALGGSAPKVELSYDSSSVDGRTSATNAQASWIGDGWDYNPGFIERSYKSCSNDGITNSGDECWGGYNATMNLAGHSGTLVRDDTTGAWHLQGDDGTKIEFLTGASNGAWNGEYVKVSDTTGMVYYFGLNHLPGGDNTDPASNSTWSVPVYSPHAANTSVTPNTPADPCYSSSTGSASWCQMAWRWNLDYVVDPHGNLITYTYTPETNYYSRGGGQNNGTGTLTAYTRGGSVATINYGQTLAGQLAAKGSAKAAAQIAFNLYPAGRCSTVGGFVCYNSTTNTYTTINSSNSSHWPDVPYDQNCASSGSCTNYGPSFWSNQQLTSITTNILSAGKPVPVDSYALSQTFANDPGDGTKPPMWLSSVRRTGLDGGNLQLPAVTFTPVMLANRVDGTTLVPAPPAFNRPRIQQITTETGEQIGVDYNLPQCSRLNNVMPASADSDQMACYNVKWYPPGSISGANPTDDWFNRYTVKDISENDPVAHSPARDSFYTYGNAAWHYDDSELTDPKTRTWGNFRGFDTVTTITGSGNDGPQTKTVVHYLQGMDGDHLANGQTRSVSVPTSLGGANVVDSDWLSGQVLEKDTYNQAGSNTITAYTVTQAAKPVTTATHGRGNGLPDLVARYNSTLVTTTSKALKADGTSWQSATTITNTDSGHANRTVSVDSTGDNVTEVCTRTGYANSTNTLMTGLVDDVLTVSGANACTATPTQTNTVSESQALYDGQPYGQAATTGDATASIVLDHFDSTGSPKYVTTAKSTYDSYGRTATTTDPNTTDSANPNGLTATTSYASANVGELPNKVTTTTSAPGSATAWGGSVTLDIGRALPLVTTDINTEASTETYDALGRLTAVWGPGQATTGNANEKFSYAVNGTTAPSTTTTQVLGQGNLYDNTSVQIFDGLGRIRQVQATPAISAYHGRILTDTFYDSHGWTSETRNPYYDNSSAPNTTLVTTTTYPDTQVPGETSITYDGQGRPLSRVFSSYNLPQSTTTISYPGADETDTQLKDANGNTVTGAGATTRTLTDVRGETTSKVVVNDTPMVKLTGGQTIASGTTLSNGSVRLAMQADGNLVLYPLNGNTALWATGTFSAGSYAQFGTDGNLQVYTSAGTSLWSTNLAATTGSVLQLQNDANLVIDSSTGGSLWASGTSGQAAEYDETTSYTYTPVGQVASQTDGTGKNSWSRLYDPRGRVIQSTDPDTGTSTTNYDADGRVSSTTDANKNTIVTSYDLLGRPTATYNGSVTPANQLTGNTYDTDPGAKGKPVDSIRYVGGNVTGGSVYKITVNTYNTRYQPTKTTVSIPGVDIGQTGTFTYTTQAAYDPVTGQVTASNASAVADIPSETLTYAYDVNGVLTSYGSNSTTYDLATNYDAFGHPTRTTLNPWGTEVVDTTNYEPATGRIESNFVDNQTSTTGAVDQTSYTYNTAGQTTSIQNIPDNTPARTNLQCFTYDYLGRLSTAWTDTGTITTQPAPAIAGTGACTHTSPTSGASTPTSTTVGGPAPYWNDYGYDITGNRTSLIQHDPTGNVANTTTTAQTFAPAGQANTPTAAPNTGGGTGGPHALISTSTQTGTGSPATTQYQYDADGNTTAISGTPGTTNMTWNSENKLSTLTNPSGKTTYIYNPDGSLLEAKGPTSTIVHFGIDEAVYANGSLHDTRTYTTPNGVSIVLQAGTETFQISDTHGTNGLAINAKSSTLTENRRYTDPFGNPRGTAPTGWIGDKGFVGGTQDATTGLTNLGAREYQPTTGRFINPDPLLDATGDPQQWNGYAYSNNDPINLSDPTGLMCHGGVDSPGCTPGGGSADPHSGDPGGGGVDKPSSEANQAATSQSMAGAAAAQINAYHRIINTILSKIPKDRLDTFLKDLQYAMSRPDWTDPNGAEGTYNWLMARLRAAINGPLTLGDLWNGAKSQLVGFGVGTLGGAACAYFEAPPACAVAAGAIAGMAAQCTDNCDSATQLALAAIEGAVTGYAGAKLGAVGSGGDTAELSDGELRSALCLNSFPGSQPVLVANGSQKPIDQIKVGDQVVATNPLTGRTQVEPVTAVIKTLTDTDFTDLTIHTTAGNRVITSTQHHPYWDETTQRWTNAADLHAGDQLREPNGAATSVASVRNYTSHIVTYNLTVADIHTYYVVAGETAVLVHNCPQAKPQPIPKGIKYQFIAILRGNGIPQVDSNGVQKIFQGWKPTQSQWAGSLEYNVPSPGPGDEWRILFDPATGRMGWTDNHYQTIQEFPDAMYPSP